MIYKLNISKLLFISFVLANLFLVSCYRDYKKKELITVFERLAEKTPQEKLRTFQLSEMDTSCRMFKIFYYEIDSISKDISKMNNLNAFLDSTLESDDNATRVTFLTIAFHEYLKGKDPLSKEVKVKLKKALSYQWDKLSLAYSMENQRIARNNYNSINIRDTILLTLPVENNYGHPYTFFKLGYPYSYDYSDADDSLLIKVVLINKFYEDKENITSVDSNCLMFKVKILKVSDSNVEIRAENKNENTFDFCLQHYGRRIIEKNLLVGGVCF